MENTRMKHSVLITGANGQLGNEMRLIAQNSNNQYIFTDVEELDITNRKVINDMMTTYHIDVIVNCACSSGGKRDSYSYINRLRFPRR